MYCDRYQNDYYISDTKARLPIRWMSWEALLLVSYLNNLYQCFKLLNYSNIHLRLCSAKCADLLIWFVSPPQSNISYMRSNMAITAVFVKKPLVNNKVIEPTSVVTRYIKINIRSLQSHKVIRQSELLFTPQQVQYYLIGIRHLSVRYTGCY